MPFQQPVPRPFNVNSIRQFAPMQCGVYGISNASEWIYIGESENIQASLLGHFGDAGSALAGRFPTGFVYEVCDLGRRHLRQDRLVLEYEPAFNRGGVPSTRKRGFSRSGDRS
jgi:hypothetical protein